MRLIDSHTHLEGFAQRGELAAVLERARAAEVERMIAIGTSPQDWDLYRRLASENPGLVFFSIGIHPCAVDRNWEAAVAAMSAYWGKGGGRDGAGGAGAGQGGEGRDVRPPAAGPRPVAMGECGLDRFHLPKDNPEEAANVFDRQQRAFRAQLALARDLACPVVVHSRGAFQECVRTIDASGVDWRRVVFHCFAEGPAEMAQLTERGGRGSFTGIVTYRTADAVRAAALAQGSERLMLETDAPYLAPVPHRGKPNEPAFLRHTFDAIAALFGSAPDRLSGQIQEATEHFFGL